MRTRLIIPSLISMLQVFILVFATAMSRGEVADAGNAANEAPSVAPDLATEAAASHMRLILLNIATYDADQQALPKTLEDLVTAKITSDGGVYVFRNQRTGKMPGFVYVKPPEAARLADIKAPADTPVLYELKDGKPDPAGLVGYADGHVRIPSIMTALALVEKQTNARGGAEKTIHARGGGNKPVTPSEVAFIQLSSSDPQEVELALDQVFKVMTTKVWCDRVMAWMLETKRYDELEKYAVATIRREASEVMPIQKCQAARVRAKLLAGKPADALVQAKALYNVCSLKETNTAIELLCQCLYEANKDGDGVGMVKRFRQEQVDGAVAATAAPTTRPRSMLSGISAQSAVMTEIPGKGRSAGDVKSLLARGNLLLLADRPQEAEALFRKAQTMPSSNAEFATEGVARAIRAQDGAVGRANAWIMEATPAGDKMKALIGTASTITPAPEEKEAGATGNGEKPKHNTDDTAFERLSSGDPLQVQAGLDQVFKAMTTKVWCDRVMEWMLEAKRYDELEKYAVATIWHEADQVTPIQKCQTARVRAKLLAGKPEEALIQAKSLYNVCSLKETDTAIELLCQCLQEVNKNGNAGEIVKRFRQEQVDGPDAVTEEVPTTRPKSILSGISVPAVVINQPIRKKQIMRGGIQSLIADGNLLLLADRPQEAEALFRKAQALATAEDLAVATEGVARAIRAEDGVVGRANAWFMAQAKVEGDAIPAAGK